MRPLTASLPMYDWPELQADHDIYWRAIRTAFGAGPATLTRGIPDLMDHWQRPDLLLSQSCGLPYGRFLQDKTTLIGTPDYGLPDDPPGHYHSVLIVRADDDRQHVTRFAADIFAFNDNGSQSGWAAPMIFAARQQMQITQTLETGSHRASIRAVAAGKAGFAAIDAVTWAIAQRHEPATQSLRVIARTPPTAGLPYICAPGIDAPALRAAITQAITALPEATRDALMLRGFCAVPRASYDAIAQAAVPHSQALHG